ncbi:MAG: hypothetical protein KGY75_01110 [Candidatus Cloacimonetes bacterium]|nr:hypothetical protein [Candidatus Cloacimonadota bacterium]MBS3766711.1 hypothetical protein [Candidatus Cloacimonadota bacterium]
MELNLVKIETEKCILSEKTFDVFTKKEYPTSSEIPPYPLLVVENKDNYHLLYGIQEFKQWKNKHNNLMAYVLPKDLKFQTLFDEVINYHIRHHDLNHFEISNTINMLRNKNFSETDITNRFCRTLDIAPTKNMVRDYLSLQKINNRVVIFLINKDASLKQWLIFPELDDQTQSFLAKIIAKLQPSLSSLTQLAKNILEIAKRDNKETKQVIKELKLKENIKNYSKQLALQKLREIVRNSRYPVLEKYKKNKSDKIKSLNLPKSIKIVPDKTMETKNFRIQISIESKQDIGESIKYLIENSNTIKNLLDIL